MDMLGIDFAVAHAEAVTKDNRGVLYLLSPRQVADYHHRVLQNYGIPKSYFGGTRFGDYLSPDAYRNRWCFRCDRES